MIDVIPLSPSVVLRVSRTPFGEGWQWLALRRGKCFAASPRGYPTRQSAARAAWRAHDLFQGPVTVEVQR